jgi:hypothetical protein
VPLTIEPSEVGQYPREDNQKGSHRIGTIEESLKSSDIGTIYSMKYRRSSTEVPG